MRLELDALHHELVMLALVRRSLADKLFSVGNPARAQRLATQLKEQLGLIATGLDALPRNALRPKGGVVAVVDRLLPLATKGMDFRGGRRPGSLDPLDRVLVDILKADPRMTMKDVLEVLKRRKGAGVIVTTRWGMLGRAPRTGLRRKSGLLVAWRHADSGKEHKTAVTTLRNRVARLRKLLLTKPR